MYYLTAGMLECFPTKLVNKKMKQVKVNFEITEGLKKGASESMWADVVSENQYKLDSIPFFAYGISCGDIVEAKLIENDIYQFEKVIVKSGNSTYRILVKDHWTKKEVHENLKDILQLGCIFEGGEFDKFQIFALNLPHSIDVYKVYEFLERGQKQKKWTFEEANFEHKKLK